MNYGLLLNEWDCINPNDDIKSTMRTSSSGAVGIDLDACVALVGRKE